MGFPVSAKENEGGSRAPASPPPNVLYPSMCLVLHGTIKNLTASSAGDNCRHYVKRSKENIFACLFIKTEISFPK